MKAKLCTYWNRNYSWLRILVCMAFLYIPVPWSSGGSLHQWCAAAPGHHASCTLLVHGGHSRRQCILSLKPETAAVGKLCRASVWYNIFIAWGRGMVVRIVHQWRCTGGIRVKCTSASWSSGTWSIWVPACSTAMCRTAIREIYSSKLHLHRVQKWIKVILGSFLNRRVRECNLLSRSPPLLCLQYNDQELEMNKASAKT